MTQSLDAPLALQGGASPAGGTYAGFLPDAKIAAADGGWVAFVADVVGGRRPSTSGGCSSRSTASRRSGWP